MRSLLALALFLLPTAANATTFTNQFIQFELPPQWQCNLEGAEWVCQNTVEAKKKDAIIVLAAKIKNDQDSLEQYLTYLKSAKTYVSVQGKTVKSEVKYAKTVKLQDQVWVDSLHLESEIPGFFTRYLVTVKADIGVLITYSVNKSKWGEYVSDFDSLVNTLKVFRKQGDPINAKPADSNLFNNPIPTNLDPGNVFPKIEAQGGNTEPQPDRSRRQSGDFTLYIIGAAVIAMFILWRRRS